MKLFADTGNLKELQKKFASEAKRPYTRYMEGEGLDVLSSEYVANLREVPVKPWARRGGKGVFLHHDASQISND